MSFFRPARLSLQRPSYYTKLLCLEKGAFPGSRDCLHAADGMQAAIPRLQFGLHFEQLFPTGESFESHNVGIDRLRAGLKSYIPVTYKNKWGPEVRM